MRPAPKRATDDYPKTHHTIMRSLEWKQWEEYNIEHGPFWDIAETRECGWMSKGHWDAFVAFIRSGVK